MLIAYRWEISMRNKQEGEKAKVGVCGQLEVVVWLVVEPAHRDGPVGVKVYNLSSDPAIDSVRPLTTHFSP